MGPTKEGCPLHPGHAKVPWQRQAACIGALARAIRARVGALVWHAKRAGALAWAGQARCCLGMGRPSTHFGLGRATLPWRGQAKHALVPWHGQPKRAGALAWAGQARWCLGVGRPRAHFGLGCATLAFGKEKKKSARNFLKFCVVVYIIILSIAGKNRFKILKNEAFRGGGDN